jgi:hypothetical protein
VTVVGVRCSSGGDDVAKDDGVAGDDRDHQADGPVLGGVADAAVFGDRCAGLDAESVDLVRRRHSSDGLVDVVGLSVAGFLEDVLASGVLGCGQLGALDESQVEVGIGDDRRAAVDVADVSADDAGVRGRVEVEQCGDVGRGRGALDVQGLAGRVVALVLDVGPPRVGGRGRGGLRGLEGGQVPLEPLTAAGDAPASRTCGDEPFLLQELERGAAV